MQWDDKGYAFEGNWEGSGPTYNWKGKCLRIPKELAKTPEEATRFCESLFKVLLTPPDTNTSFHLMVNSQKLILRYNSIAWSLLVELPTDR